MTSEVRGGQMYEWMMIEVEIADGSIQVIGSYEVRLRNCRGN